MNLCSDRSCSMALAAAALASVTLLAGCVPAAAAAPAPGAPPAVGAEAIGADTSPAARIARIEAALLPAVRVRGREYVPETIEARVAGMRLPRQHASGAAERAATARPDPVADQRAFFEHLRALCGRTFGGRTILAPVDDRTFEPARLYMIVEECAGDEIRVPFIVDGDASRTWVFQMREDGLTFFHEHVRPDGTEHDVSGFGGHASAEGSPTFQSFPDFWATDETPPAERRVWRLRMDHENDLFVYYLDRGGLPAYRLVFYMGPPSPPLER
jgi:hypothetical protein